MPGKTPRYSEEFRRDAVALVHSSGKTVNEVARDLGVSSEGLRNWYKKDQAERGVPAATAGPEPGLGAAEREELRELRRRVKAQDETISILKKATAFFASDHR
jgi:transposase